MLRHGCITVCLFMSMPCNRELSVSFEAKAEKVMLVLNRMKAERRIQGMASWQPSAFFFFFFFFSGCLLNFLTEFQP